MRNCSNGQGHIDHGNGNGYGHESHGNGYGYGHCNFDNAAQVHAPGALSLFVIGLIMLALYERWKW